jgi:hypothetical protein
MARNHPYRRYVTTLAANEERQVGATGQYLFCLSATGSFGVRLDDGPVSILYAGTGFQLAAGESFGNFSVRDLSGAGNTVELAVGYGDFRDARLTVTGALDLSKASEINGFTDTVVAPGALGSFAGGATRRRRWIQNLSTTGTVHVGGAGGSVPAANFGLRLGPGQTMAIDTTGTINVFNPGSVAVTIAEIRTVD